MHKILWDFEIQTDHPISTKRQNTVLINKKRTWQQVLFCFFSEPQMKIILIDKYLDLVKLKKRLGELEIRERIKIV